MNLNKVPFHSPSASSNDAAEAETFGSSGEWTMTHVVDTVANDFCVDDAAGKGVPASISPLEDDDDDETDAPRKGGSLLGDTKLEGRLLWLDVNACGSRPKPGVETDVFNFSVRNGMSSSSNREDNLSL